MPKRKTGNRNARTRRASPPRPRGASVDHYDGLPIGVLAAEARVLEMAASNAPLNDTLDVLARVFESQADGMLASVLLIEDGKRVRHAAAPSLAPGWARLVDGEPIGPNRGSCGTAAFLGEPVIVTDIAVDPRWEMYRAAALQFGYRACWSTPILGAGREVLGTFAFYYSEPREPTDEQLELAKHASRLSAIAILRNRERDALIEAERRARLIVENALDANVQMDQDGVVSAWNAQAVTTFGWTAAEAIGKRLSELIIPPAYRERHEAGLRRYLDTGESRIIGRRVETTALHRNGHEFPVELTLAAVRSAKGTIFSAFIEDLTEKRQAAAELGRLREREQLLTAVRRAERERQEALNQAKEMAEAATRAKTLFLANMSHEIRTPMNAMLGNAQLLEREGELTPSQKRKVDVIQSSGQHLLSLINDVLEMSKIESGRAALVTKPFDLPALLRDVERMFSHLTTEKNVRLSLFVDPALEQFVEGDAVKVRQVMINLLSNAVKFTDTGGIRIEAESKPHSDDRCVVTVRVTDTGPGVAPEAVEGIFDAFGQYGPGVTAGGTGLGLAISRSYARLMGGDVTVSSTVGVGSTFTFAFVVSRARSRADETDTSAPGWRTPRSSRPVTAVEVSGIPRDLVRELRAAAIDARAARIHSLADQIAATAPHEAALIRDMADNFEYDRLLASLGPEPDND